MRSLKTGTNGRSTAIISRGRRSISQPCLAVGFGSSVTCHFSLVYHMDKVQLSAYVVVVTPELIPRVLDSEAPMDPHLAGVPLCLPESCDDGRPRCAAGGPRSSADREV